jgi:hypothetical protein
MKNSQLPLPKLLKKTQDVFNKFIRLRDAELGCISCEKGKVENAGHYLSQGHHSAFRFNEENTNGQCCKCNLYLSGNLINYRKGLVKKIGAERVEFLEGSADRRKAHKWSRVELEALIQYYNQKIKLL